MPNQTTCPSCARALRLPATYSGAKIRCPNCKTVFTPGVPADEDIPVARVLDTPARHVPEPDALRKEIPPPPLPGTRRPALDEEEPAPRTKRRGARTEPPPRAQSPAFLLLCLGGTALVMFVALVGIGVAGYYRTPTLPQRNMAQIPDPNPFNDPIRPPVVVVPRIEPPLEPPPLAPPRFDPPKVDPNPPPRKTPKRPRFGEDPENKPTVTKLDLLPLDDDDVPREGKTSTRSLAGNKIEVRGLTATRVDLSKVPKNGLVWAADGSAFYCVDGTTNTLRRLSVPQLAEEWTLELKRPVVSLTESSEGLIAVLDKGLELRVIDPQKRTVKKRISTPMSQGVTSSSATSLVVVTKSRWDGTLLLDLAADTSRVVRAELIHPVVSPDGKQVYAQSGIEQLAKFALSKDGLIKESESDRIAQNGQCVVVSPDGKHACLPAGGGNGKGYSTYIYRTDSLKNPAFTLDQGAYPRAVGFDPKSKRVYTQNYEDSVQVYDYQGVRKATHKLAEWRGQDVSAFLPSPAGGPVLILAKESPWLAQFSD